MRVDELLAGLFERAGFRGTYAPEEDGSFILASDGITVAFREVQDYPMQGVTSLLVCGRLGTLPLEGAEGTVRRLVRANANRDELGGCTLSVCDDDIYLQRVLMLAALDVDRFEAAFSRFFDTFCTWRDRISEPCEEEAPVPGEDALSMEMNGYLRA